MSKLTLAGLAALLLLALSPRAAHANDGPVVPRNEKVLASLKKARDENRRVIIKFKDGVTVTGRVGELRAASPSSRTMRTTRRF